MCGVIRMDRWRNEEFREKTIDRFVPRILKWFTHVECFSGMRMTQKVSESVVEGGKDRYWPCTRHGWTISKRCTVWGRLSSEVRRCYAWKQTRGLTLWMSQNTVWMCKVWPNVLWTQNNEGVEWNVAANDVLDSLLEAIRWRSVFNQHLFTMRSKTWTLRELHGVYTICF